MRVCRIIPVWCVRLFAIESSCAERQLYSWLGNGTGIFRRVASMKKWRGEPNSLSLFIVLPTWAIENLGGVLHLQPLKTRTQSKPLYAHKLMRRVRGRERKQAIGI